MFTEAAPKQRDLRRKRTREHCNPGARDAGAGDAGGLGMLEAGMLETGVVGGSGVLEAMNAGGSRML